MQAPYQATKGERRALKANRKYIVSLLLLFLLMGLTFYLLFHHFEFAEIWGIIRAPPADRWLWR